MPPLRALRRACACLPVCLYCVDAAGVAAYALSQGWERGDDGRDLSSDKLPWVRTLCQRSGVEEVLSPGQMLRKHPVGRWVSEEDHLVGATGHTIACIHACMG